MLIFAKEKKNAQNRSMCRKGKEGKKKGVT